MNMRATDIELWDNRIYQGDCAEVMRRLPAGSAKLVFADPPYFLQLGGELRRPDGSIVDSVDDDWDKFADFAAYDKFTAEWLGAARKVLAEDGTIAVTGTHQNIFRIGTALQNMGFWILNDIIWDKINAMPNWLGTRFANSHETIIWAKKNKNAPYTFNYNALKALNDDRQMRSVWQIPACGGSERLKDDDDGTLHPTQKPEALLYYLTIAASNFGDLIVDPFFGTGSTGAVAKALGRNWIGIERESAYINAAQARIDAVSRLEDPALLGITSKRKEQRIPFGLVLTQGLLRPGAVLYGGRHHEIKATVQANGKSRLENGSTGSIHAMGAAAQELPACNGWTFWHFDVTGTGNGTKVAIDDLRDSLRTRMTPEAIRLATTQLKEAQAETTQPKPRTPRNRASAPVQPTGAPPPFTLT